MLLDVFRALDEEEAEQDLSYRYYWTRVELWMKRRARPVPPMLLDTFRALDEEEAGQDLSHRCYWTRFELWMRKRQGKTCAIDASRRVSSSA